MLRSFFNLYFLMHINVVIIFFVLANQIMNSLFIPFSILKCIFIKIKNYLFLGCEKYLYIFVEEIISNVYMKYSMTWVYTGIFVYLSNRMTAPWSRTSVLTNHCKDEQTSPSKQKRNQTIEQQCKFNDVGIQVVKRWGKWKTWSIDRL